ncbi:hypothetical protein [Pontibacter rugosus]|uniref:Outer membrane protein n=1 Tax=Pontibacter rugosus TaxID=1745966 RepID=A0ABW3SSE7_9BACT
MKKLLVMICMTFGCVFASKASGDKSSAAVVSARANNLSDQMIKSLRLNNFQSSKIREINTQVAEQITAIEQQYAGNEAKIKQLTQEAFTARDLYLEEVLSTVQYNKYFNSRSAYAAIDQEFMSTLADNSNSNVLATVSAQQNPKAVAAN